MKNILKITAVLVCFIIFLTACNGQDTYTALNSSAPDSLSSELDIGSSAAQEETAQTEPQIDLLETMSDCGKTVTVYGELQKEQYTAAISELQSVLDSYSRNISLTVYSIGNNKALMYNTKTPIFGACTVKAAYALYACKQMENGNGNLGVPLIYEEKHYEPGTGDMQYSPFGTVFTVETALYKSMSISDNVGYLMLVDYFGRDDYNAYMRELGCDSLQIKPTVWSLHTKSNDLVKLWREIYNYFETDTDFSRFLYNSCTNTAGNYATAAISDIEYSHKQGNNSTGDWLSFSDAGIVWKGDNPYIISILTDAPGPSGYDTEVFSKITKLINKIF